MSLKPSDLAVVVTTYNSPLWLQKVLWGYAAQSNRGFEIVVADDGSTNETRQMIDQMRDETGLDIQHVWHEDQGFRKTEILNRAIVATEKPYLLFTDGDCVPRADLVATHLKHARKGRFLSAAYFKLPLDLSRAITRDDIESGRFADLKWLRQNGLKRRHGEWKLRTRGIFARILDALTPTRATWNGANSSGWKSDLVRINGFDERMRYGGLDRELGERLENANVRGMQLRHRAICLHLDHGRPYHNAETSRQNREIRRVVRETKAVWTPFGIEKIEADS